MKHRFSFSLAAFASTALFPAVCAAQSPPPPQSAPAQPAAAPPPGSPATQPAAQPAPQAYPPPPPPQGYPPQQAYPPPSYPPPAYSPAGQYAAPAAPPAYLPYESGRPIPEGYVLESGIRRGPVIAGAIVLGVPYVLGIAITDLEEERAWLLVPALGPWMTLATGDYSCDESESFDCADERAGRTVLILDGVMQTTGAVLLLYGLLSPRERLVRQDLYRGLMVTPQLSARGGGLIATGEF